MATFNINKAEFNVTVKSKVLLLDGQGAAQKGSLSASRDCQGLVWVRLSPNNVRMFLKKMPLAPSLVSKFLSTEETRPRTLFHENTLLGTYRGINFNEGQELEDMVAVRLWIKNNLIITVQRRNLVSIDTIEKNLLQGNGPKTSGQFLETLLDELTDKSTDIISTLGNQLDTVEELDAPKQQLQENYEALSNLRRRIILLNRYLGPQCDAISRFSVNKLSWLTAENLDSLKEIANSNRLILEDLQAERERAKVIQEEFSALDQKLLNRKMYLLAIVTVIFMPLTFITGLLGVNLGGIPGATAHYAFSLLIIVLIIVGAIQVIQLKKMRWL